MIKQYHITIVIIQIIKSESKLVDGAEKQQKQLGKLNGKKRVDNKKIINSLMQCYEKNL